MHKTTAIRFYLKSCGIILLITGLAKIWTAFSKLKILFVADPILSIKFGHLMLMVGLIEIVLGTFCFFGKWTTFTSISLASFATNLLIYRVGLWWIDWKKPCSCLGNLSDALHIFPQTADSLMKALLAYLLIGSYVSLMFLWRQRKTACGTPV